MNLNRGESFSKSMIEHDIDPFSVVLRRYAFSFVQRLLNCDNNILQVLTKWKSFHSSALNRNWTQMLFSKLTDRACDLINVFSVL